MKMLEADLSAGKGVLWLKSPHPAPDGTLFVARYMGQGRADFQPGADLFVHLVFGPSGDRFAAVDARGTVYVFHLRANRFSLAHAAGQEVTAISFSPGRENDLIIGLADNSIRVISSDSGATVATLKSHRQAVSSICPHPMGRFLVTCSLDACILWDLKALKRMQNIGSSGRIGAIQTAFLHSGNTLITLSRTEGLFLYHFPTLTLRARLTAMSPASESKQKQQRLQFRCFALTPNRMYIVAATTDTRAYVWHLPSETMVEQLSLPVPCATRAYGSGILQALVPYASVEMPESSRLAYVGEDGVVRIIDVPSGNVVRSVGVAAHAFAMYKERIALSSADGSVRLSALTQRGAGKSRWVGTTKFKSVTCSVEDASAPDEPADVENAPANRRRPLSAAGQRSSSPGARPLCSASAWPRTPSVADACNLHASLPGAAAKGSDGGPMRGRVTGIEVQVKPRAGQRRRHSAHAQHDSRAAANSSLASCLASSPTAASNTPTASAGVYGGGQPTGGKGGARCGGVAGDRQAANLQEFYQRELALVQDGAAQETSQMVERLRAFLDVHGSFTEQHRLSVYRQVLRLPENQKAYGSLVDMGTHALGTRQLQQYNVPDSRLRLRLSRVVHALAHWCEALACCAFLPSFVYPWLQLFGRNECLCVETCIMFLLNWGNSWFSFWPSPPLQSLAAVDRLLFVLDPQLVRHLGNIQTSAKDYAWPLLATCLSEVLDRKAWLHLMDHVLLQPPDHMIYILVAFLHHCRRPLLSVQNIHHLDMFRTQAHPVDVQTVLRIARDLSRDPRARALSENMGVHAVCDQPLTLQHLGSSSDTLAYPMLLSFPKAEVNNHVAQYEQIREDEERYLRQKKLAAELEDHAKRLASTERAVRLEDDLLEQARSEQRQQLQMLAQERRERARRIEERSRLTRLAQIKWMTQQEAEVREAAVQKQCKLLQDLDGQLAERIQEDEEWLESRLEAEKLQELEFAAAMKLHKSMQERQNDAQQVTLQAELEARRQVLEMQKRSSEQRWAIEDNQRCAERNLSAAEAAQQMLAQQQMQDRMTAEMQIKVEEEQQRSRMLVVEAQRQAQALAEEQHLLAEQRRAEQRRVEEVLAAEEMRHLDAVTKREEQLMLERMEEAEKLIRGERAHLAAMKERRRRQLRALQARQRIEGFEKQVLEQKGSWKLAAQEHDREVHRILLDLEEERRSLLSMDEEIQLREKELRTKVESLDAQRLEHAYTFGHRSPASPAGAAGASASGRGGRGHASGARGHSSPRSTGKFAHLSDDSGQDEENADETGTSLEFTPKALRRQSPSNRSTAQPARAGVRSGNGQHPAAASPSKEHLRMNSPSGQAAVNLGDRPLGDRPPLFVGRTPPASPNKGAQGVAEAVVMAAVGLQRQGADDAGAGPASRASPSRPALSAALSAAGAGDGGGVAYASRPAQHDVPSMPASGNALLRAGGKKPGEKGYWQMRAAMAGVELSTPVRIKASSTATTAVASSGKRHAFSDTMSGSGRTSGDGGMQGDSSCDLSSAGSDALDEQSWVKRDVARARAAVASRFAARANETSATCTGASSSGVVVDLPPGGRSFAATLSAADGDATTSVSED